MHDSGVKTLTSEQWRFSLECGYLHLTNVVPRRNDPHRLEEFDEWFAKGLVDWSW